MHMGSENADSENLTNNKIINDPSFRQRMLVIDIIVPIVLFFALLGGLPYAIFTAAVLGVAGWEFWRLFCKGGYHPSLPIMLVSIIAAVLLRYLWGFAYMDMWLAFTTIAAMFVHIIQQQKGNLKAASNFAITVCGAVYLGWLGSYAISLRFMESGLGWTLLVFPIISIADSGAYFVGRLIGKHKIIPNVSPNKSWEGYLGGILSGILGGWGIAALWHIAYPEILPLYGIIFGLIISITAPIGDFGESMIKRQFGAKDSSNILPGHGGIFDRIDSMLWTGMIGYYLILLIR